MGSYWSLMLFFKVWAFVLCNLLFLGCWLTCFCALGNKNCPMPWSLMRLVWNRMRERLWMNWTRRMGSAVWYKIIKITLLRVIPAMTFIRFVTGKSSGILSDISSGNFWHFIWHIFWHSIWHIFWHSTWHIFCKHIFWHSIWHIFCNSIWHSGILSGISSGILSGILSGISSGTLPGISSAICSGISSGILPGISCGILSGISSGTLPGISSAICSGISSGTLSGISSDILSGILGFYLAYLLAYLLALYLAFYLTFYLAYLLAFYLAVEVHRCTLSWAGPRLTSSGAHWAGQVPGWGPAVHWAGHVPGWGPAVHTELGRSQFEVQRCTLSWAVPG